jgi:DegV family protein with EDD domain
MTSQQIALITDSSCDLPGDLLEQYAIQMVPLYLIWGPEELRDRVDIMPTAFYQRLASGAVLPTTSQPHPHDFIDAIQQAEQAGAAEAVIFTISSGMSSTNHSAQIAQDKAGIPVHVIDSKANSMSLGWQVLAAARTREAGGSAQAMIDAADAVRQHSVTLLYVDTLEYLHRGGRIGGAARWVGTLLHLKPQLYVDHETGVIKPGHPTRTRTKALESMYQDFFDQLDTSKPLRVAVLHGNIPETAQAFADRIAQEYAPVEMIVTLTSPVMGVHTGPGALALCGYAEH